MGLQNDASLPQLAGATAMDGVSILPNFQTQFGQVIRTKSLGFLLNKMAEQRRALEKLASRGRPAGLWASPIFSVCLAAR